MTQYYFSNGHEPSGPFTLDELGQQVLTPTSLVWHTGMTEWQPAADVAELRPLLPVVPPPIRRAAAGPPPIRQEAVPVAPPTAAASYQGQPTVQAMPIAPDSKPNNKNLVAGATAALLVLLVAGLFFFLRKKEGQMVVDSAALAVGVNDAVKQAKAAQREKDREWSRKHFLEFVSVEVNSGYSVGLFGGISGGTLRIHNTAGYQLKDIIVGVEYYKPDGSVINNQIVYVAELPARDFETFSFPDSERGVSVSAHFASFSVPGLDYKYDWTSAYQ